jgi:hypothetical protein
MDVETMYPWPPGTSTKDASCQPVPGVGQRRRHRRLRAPAVQRLAGLAELAVGRGEGHSQDGDGRHRGHRHRGSGPAQQVPGRPPAAAGGGVRRAGSRHAHGPGIPARRLAEPAGDAAPQLGRGRLAVLERRPRAEARRHLHRRVDLGPAARARGQVPAHDLGLLGVDGVQGVRPQQALDLLVAGHSSLTPLSENACRIRRSPFRMRLFTVPSGWLSLAATSR